MPPKIKISKTFIVEAALDLVREQGIQELNARTLAKYMRCSTQPIFSNYSSMDELKVDVLKKAYETYFQFTERELERGEYPEYKAYGMAYIRFAKKEKELFKLVFMRDRSEEIGDEYMDETMEDVMKVIRDQTGVAYDKLGTFHMAMWTYVHGIATMLATDYIQLEWDEISDMITTAYKGLLQQYCGEET